MLQREHSAILSTFIKLLFVMTCHLKKDTIHRPLDKSAYSKTCLKGHSQRRPKLVFKTDYCLMQVKSIAECSKRSILQYFGPSLSYYLSLRSLFCLFLRGRLRLVLLYLKFDFPISHQNHMSHLDGTVQYGKCSKISNNFLFLFSKTEKTLIRLLKKQSDLGLQCLLYLKKVSVYRPLTLCYSYKNANVFT